MFTDKMGREVGMITKIYVLSRPSRLYDLFPSPPPDFFFFFYDVGMVFGFLFPFKILRLGGMIIVVEFMITTIVVFIRRVCYSYKHCELYVLVSC